MRTHPAIRPLISSPAAQRVSSTIKNIVTRPATAGIPAIATAVLARPHGLVMVLALAAAALLAPAAAVVAAELPRLYWLVAYTRLVRKGTKLAATSQEVLDLIAGLAAAQGLVPEPPRHSADEAAPKRHSKK
jgi:hypothetical protein